MAKEEELKDLKTEVENVLKLRMANHQEKRDAADILLEEDLESDIRDSLVYAHTLLEKLDILLAVLEGVGNLLVEYETQN